MDEATAYLPREDVGHLFDAVEKLAVSGAGVVFVTHRLEEVRRLSHRVTVLRDGACVAAGQTASFSDRELVELIVGRSMTDLYPQHGDVREDVIFAAESVSGSEVKTFDLRLHRGETVGVTGLAGMGQESIPYLLFGSDPQPSGHISVAGKRIDLKDVRPGRAIQLGMGLVPGDRLRHGGSASATVRENMTLTTVKGYFDVVISVDVTRGGRLASSSAHSTSGLPIPSASSQS